MDNPTMLYRSPGLETLEGVSCETKIVDEAEVEAHKAEGWFSHWIHAGEAWLKAQEEAAKKAVQELEDKAAATREEAIQQLEQLGVVFDRRLGLSKLLALIEDELKKRAAPQSDPVAGA